MTAWLEGKAVSVNPNSMEVTENILLTFTYQIEVDDVQKKTQMMSQIQNIVNQYKPAFRDEAEEENEMAE